MVTATYVLLQNSNATTTAPLHCTQDRDSPPEHIPAPTPSTVTQQHPETCQGMDPDPAVPLGVLHRVALTGASPIMCLAPWPSLPRAAYVLTGRNTGKQLAASDPVVSQQESIQMPIPPFHG